MKFFLFLFVIIQIQCAFMNPSNRRLTSALDDSTMIKDKPPVTKFLLAPIAIPVGATTLATDILVVHPLSTIAPSLKDAYKTIWSNPSGGFLFQVFLFVPKTVFTVPYVTIDIVIRSIFDVN